MFPQQHFAQLNVQPMAMATQPQLLMTPAFSLPPTSAGYVGSVAMQPPMPCFQAMPCVQPDAGSCQVQPMSAVASVQMTAEGPKVVGMQYMSMVPLQQMPNQSPCFVPVALPATGSASFSSRSTMSPRSSQCSLPPTPQAPCATGGSESRPRLQSGDSVSSIAGNVWTMAQDQVGSRQVQLALEMAESDDARAKIAAELEGHVWAAMTCPNANFVLQQVITSLRGGLCNFIVEEILMRGTGAVCKAARHAFGCRVLQRLLEHWPELTTRMVDDLLSEGLLLCRHTYGNYVMQHVLEYGSLAHRHQLLVEMTHHALALGFDSRAGGSVSKAIAHAAPTDRTAFVRALLTEKRALAAMACTRHGHLAVQHVLQLCGECEQLEARRQLEKHAKKLQASRYGRAVLQACRQY